MLGVDSESGISGTKADGILGMAPSVSPGENAQLLVSKLYSAGIISSNSFGVDYNTQSSTSKIILGGYDSNVVTNSSLFSYVGLRDTYYWSLDLKSTTYGSEDLGLSAVRGILDTGTSLTYFSQSDWDILYNKFSEGKTCGYTNSGFRAWYCTSDADFEDITFHFGNYLYYFPASSYIEVTTGITTNTWVLYIDSISINFGTPSILLGDSFLRNYYIYHDVTNKQVGMYGTWTEGGWGFALQYFTVIALTLLAIFELS